MDWDMPVLEDIVNLWKLRDDRCAVLAVKHHQEWLAERDAMLRTASQVTA